MINNNPILVALRMFIKKLRLLYFEFREIAKFFGYAFLLLFAWVLVSSYFPGIIHELHFSIIKPQADISAFFLRIFGYQLTQTYMDYGCMARLIFAEHGSICVGTGCSGLELYLLFFGFILLMKGSWKDKIWFIPLGFLTILALNIIRIVVLSIIYYYVPQYLNFNHKYTFVIIVYAAMFGLWIFWVKKFSTKKTD